MKQEVVLVQLDVAAEDRLPVRDLDMLSASMWIGALGSILKTASREAQGPDAARVNHAVLALVPEMKS
ncbi:MAG: hypothetical protein J2P50_02580 [Hyphomicrobiaceae bacterium]|nr:hypothetical protein [Hyphomicrobiaceae bacterium]